MVVGVHNSVVVVVAEEAVLSLYLDWKSANSAEEEEEEEGQNRAVVMVYW